MTLKMRGINTLIFFSTTKQSLVFVVLHVSAIYCSHH